MATQSITPAQKKALRTAITACFPGITLSMLADKRAGRKGCLRINGRIHQEYTVECFTAFSKALDEIDVDVDGVSALAARAEGRGCSFVSFDAEPMED